MRRTPSTFLLLVCLAASGCFVRLIPMAQQNAATQTDCSKKELKTKKLNVEGDLQWSHFRFEGCGRWAEYRGSCQGEHNGCDVTTSHPDCQGVCRVELVADGELAESGE